MPKFFVAEEQIQGNYIHILGSDVNHITKVLREKEGNEITIGVPSKIEEYQCKIEKIKEDEVICHIQKTREVVEESNIQVTIMQGLPKADKMEWVIQKSVELGVYEIQPLEMKRCIVKLQDKDKRKKTQRWQKIAEVAAKQSGRGIIPEVKEAISLKQIYSTIKEYDAIIVAYEEEKQNTIKAELKRLKERIEKQEKGIVKIGVIIGPEGGIDKEEIIALKEYAAKIVTLGKRILRTETVSLHILSLLLYELEE